MNRFKLPALLGLALCFALSGALLAQGVQSGTLNGTVTSNDGSPLPGVTVTVTSDALQGSKTTVSGVNGDYVIRALPPGVYKVIFSLEGMKSVERTATVALGGIARADAPMEVAAAEETIVVTGEAPSALETTTIGANISADQLDKLPVQLTAGSALTGIADLSGGLTDNGTVAGQVTIGGAFAYDNVFLVNGVDVNDRFFGNANDLFIEDAIDETQVMTSGISAEYGRFSGGVVNAITKSGGNEFTGSLRADYSKPEWRDETPFEKNLNQKRTGDLGKIYTATLGGPILKDRLWFFVAGRDTKQVIPRNLQVSGVNVDDSRKNQRYEVKLTLAATPNHSLVGSYINNERTDTKEIQVNPLTPFAVSDNSKRPNDGFSFAYNGVFTNSLFGELRYSEKTFDFVGLGGTETARSESPFRSRGRRAGTVVGVYNSPYFDATDPESRNNKQLYGALSYFLSSEKLGSHDVKFGVEQFTDIGIGGNSQSASNYIYRVDYRTTASGAPVFSAEGDLIPVWDPGRVGSRPVRVLNWIPTRGAKNEIVTSSAFLNDRWSINKNFSVNVGLRYEKIDSKSQAGIPKVGADSIVPRLGLSYDLRGDGKYKFDVTYSEYSGKANANQFGVLSPSGNPSLAYGYYVGPAGEGKNFAPAFDNSNYVYFYFFDPLQTACVGTWNNSTNRCDKKDLKTPKTKEIGVAYGMSLAKGGYLKLSYTRREMSDFIENFIDTTTGLAEVTFPGFEGSTPAEIVNFRNSSKPVRKYEGLLLDGSYRITDNWSVAGNWTYQLKNYGDFEGEAGQSPATNSAYGDYPEIFPLDRINPKGTLANYQEHKIRLWTSYGLDLGRAGALDFGLIYRYDSALSFSYTALGAALSDIQFSRDPGYYGYDSSGQTLYFGKRGEGRFNPFWSADFSVEYAIPVWKTVEPWVKLTITNVTNQDTLVTYNTSISPNDAGPKDSNGLATTYIKSVNFGKPINALSYQTPREYFISAGIRF